MFRYAMFNLGEDDAMLTKNMIHAGYGKPSERGIALILCIGFLAILSILGAVVLTTTNNEIDQSWRERAEKDVFYTVDRAVEYALSPPVLADLVNPGDAEDLSRAGIADEIALYYDSTHPKYDSWGTTIIQGEAYDPNNPDTWASKVVYEGFGGNPTKADKYNKKIGAGKVFRLVGTLEGRGFRRTVVPLQHPCCEVLIKGAVNPLYFACYNRDIFGNNRVEFPRQDICLGAAENNRNTGQEFGKVLQQPLEIGMVPDVD